MVKINRTRSGMTLIELLSAMFIMSFVAAAITEIAVTQNYVAFRTYNKIDGLIAARSFETELERELHTAHNIGSQFSGSNPPYWVMPPSSTAPQTLLIFQTPVNCTQIPATFWLPSSYLNGSGQAMYPGLWNVDTYIYQIVADSSNPGKGQFVLQKSIQPGYRPNLPNIQFSPAPPFPIFPQAQTILKGIVGPINPSDTTDPIAGTPAPRVFSFITSAGPTTLSYAPSSQPPATPTFGVSINTELFSNSSSSRSDLTPQTVPVHAEFFLRANAFQ